MREKKYFGRFKKALAPMPSLVESQMVSFNWLLKEGLGEMFKEFSPIKDYSDKKFELSFVGFEIDKPRFD